MKEMTHLTTESLHRLMWGTAAPAEARALAEHLDQECAACDALIASSRGAPLDALTDHALTALAPPRRDEAGNDLEFARIQRALRARAPTRPPTRRWAPLAVAAALLVTVGVTMQLTAGHHHEDRWDGLKGIAQGTLGEVAVRLSAVAVLARAGSEPHVWKVASGDVVPHDAALQLRIEVGRAADVAVARAGPGDTVDVFWHQRIASAGTVQLTVDDRPAAYPLSTLSGPQRFVVLASPVRLAAERIAAAASALAPPGRVSAESPAVDGLSIDVVDVTVR